MSTSSVKTGVVGATGYTGAELVSLLSNHPSFDCSLITSRQYAGQPLASVYPRFEGQLDLTCQNPDVDDLNQCDLLFLAVPHGTSMELVPDIDLDTTRVVDLAGDYRMNDPSLFKGAYGMEHSDPQRLSSAVYGLSEYNADDIQGSRLVANPGCYVSSFLLPMIPLVREQLVEPPLFVDSKSGISGAGRTPSETTTFMNVSGEVKPYNIGSHRHQAEMTFHLPEDHPVTFAPHVVSAKRGIESAIYMRPTSDGSQNNVEGTLRNLCDQHDVLRYRESPVGMKAVAHTSYCDLSVYSDSDSIVVISCLDNLRKGAASQAIQNANLMFEHPMNEGIFG